MAELAVEMTYGTALYEAASERKKTEQIRSEAEEVLQILENEPELLAFINYPVISAGEKKEVLRNIFEGNICEELLNFLYVLIDKRRMGALRRILRVYADMVDHEEGVSYGTVYSAVPLDEKRLAEIEEQTSKLLREKIKLTNEIDPEILAGVRVLAEGKVIDASYRKRLDEMASQLNLA